MHQPNSITQQLERFPAADRLPLAATCSRACAQDAWELCNAEQKEPLTEQQFLDCLQDTHREMSKVSTEFDALLDLNSQIRVYRWSYSQ